jgi:hypothetical protein
VSTVRHPRIAQPGDPDLDCDLVDVRIGSVVVDHDSREIIIGYRDGHGRWIDITGTDGPVNNVTGTVSMMLPDIPGDMWANMVGQLESWRDTNTSLRMCSAPGRLSTLVEDRDRYVLIPRNWPSWP